jgi:hypothetical protein
LLAKTVTSSPLNINHPTTLLENEFKKSTDGVWVGKNNISFKLDKDFSLLSSTDGKKWEKAKEQMWQDKDNYWYKVEGKKFLCSKDAVTWKDGKNMKGENANWEAEDGMWCKFDKTLALWVKKPGN